MNSDNIITACKNCGVKNRIPKNRLNDSPVCGRCGTPLPPVRSEPLTITDRSFQQEIISHPGPALVDCWAAWCAPCRMVAPILDQLAKEYSGRVLIAKLDIDANPETAARYNVMSVPTLLLFNNGNLVDTLVGALPKQEIEKRLQSLV